MCKHCKHAKDAHDVEVEYSDGIVFECSLCDCGCFEGS